MKSRIYYGYAHFDFDWKWIKDKQIILKGDKYIGMLIILDKDGNAVGMYGYELISENKNNNVP
jgi:hypothetical protein